MCITEEHAICFICQQEAKKGEHVILFRLGHWRDLGTSRQSVRDSRGRSWPQVHTENKKRMAEPWSYPEILGVKTEARRDEEFYVVPAGFYLPGGGGKFISRVSVLGNTSSNLVDSHSQTSIFQ